MSEFVEAALPFCLIIWGAQRLGQFAALVKISASSEAALL